MAAILKFDEPDQRYFRRMFIAVDLKFIPSFVKISQRVFEIINIFPKKQNGGLRLNQAEIQKMLFFIFFLF